MVLAIIWGLWPKPVVADFGEVTHGPMRVSVLEEGKTRIRHRYTISPPVSGYLRRVELRAGAQIIAGQTVLAVIEAEPASLLNPRAQSEAEARVSGAEALLNQRQAELERTQQAADLARREKDRAEQMKKSGALSAKDWDTAELNAAIRARELRSAEFALQVGQFELQQARAALLQAEGGAAAAGQPFTILAPATGYVLNVFEESARIVVAGTPVMEVGDPTDLEAEIELLSTDAAGVRPGAEAMIERWGGPRPLRAHVELVEPAAFTKISALGVEEQRVKVRVSFDEGQPGREQLGDRYRVEARIVIWSSGDVLKVPTGALFRRGGDWVTFLITGSRVRWQKVETGHDNGLEAEVLGGLAAGQRVVVHPPDGLTPGAIVREGRQAN